MSEDQFRRISESIRERGARPSKVQFDEMVQRGVIDPDGKVKIRRPEPETEVRNAKDRSSIYESRE